MHAACLSYCKCELSQIVLSDLFLQRYSWILQVGAGADAVSTLQGQRENEVKEQGVEADI